MLARRNGHGIDKRSTILQARLLDTQAWYYLARTSLIYLWLITMSGCVQQAPYKHRENEDAKPLVFSHMKLLTLNGKTTDNQHELSLSKGENTLVARRQTYQMNYDCIFVFNAKPGFHYEITDQSNPEPMTLYRLNKKNIFWHIRTQPVIPVNCTATAR